MKSVISLISYDYKYLPTSIKKYYNYVDEIVLGLDKDRISWSGNPFKVDMDWLIRELKALDTDQKISLVEENFHKSNVAIENDNFERNYLKSQCSGDWIFSFDADEELVNAEAFFIKFLPLVEKYKNKYDLIFTWVLPYKELNDSYLVIANEDGSVNINEKQGFATSPEHTFMYARWTDNAQKQNSILTPLIIKHWSLCRNEKDLKQKLLNIGHSDKAIQGDPFFDLWSQVNETNWDKLANFKTTNLGQGQWERLIRVPKDKLDLVLSEIQIYK